jgi:hypothetical protein
MASNERKAPSGGKGQTASDLARQRVANRRSNPVVPTAPQSNHAGTRARESVIAGKQARAQGGAGAGPVPAEKNAADRTLQRMADSKAARQNRGQ